MLKSLTHNASFMLSNEDLDSAVYALRELQKNAQLELSRSPSKEESEWLTREEAGWREIADRVEAIAERRFYADVEVNQKK